MGNLIDRLKAQGFAAWQIGYDFYRVDAPGFHAALDGAAIIKMLEAAEGK